MDTSFLGAARPILASSLLPPDHDVASTASSLDEDEWRLDPDIYGDDASGKPAAALVSAGQIMGISSLIPHIDYEGSVSGERGDVREWVDELSVHFLLSLIARTPSAARDRPRAFVIQCSGCRPLSTANLHGFIQAKMPAFSPEETETILSSVNIFHASEFGQILSAVDQVSDLLFKIEQHEETENEHIYDLEHDTTGSPAGKTKLQLEINQGKEVDTQPPILLLIEGMDLALQEIIRVSDTDAAGAQLAAFLRTLTLLCQTYKSLLTVIIVNSIPLRPQPPMCLQLSPEELQAQLRAGTTLVETPLTSPYRIEDMETPVESAFDTVRDGRLITASPYPPNQALSLLADVFSEGIDIQLVVSNVENEWIVEVVKDRVGDNLGRWDVF
ncbi:hypothetical protein FQN49_003388 [Arthroderma sp. PD_2]|nr:hypothetical protein FQN49_003388 [Arthroderma sp. PD_2]